MKKIWPLSQPGAYWILSLPSSLSTYLSFLFQTDDCIASNSSTHAYCVVYSTADRNSFHYAEESLQALWKLPDIRSKAVILVANKTDLVRSRVVSTQGNIDI